jgi:hypothetical protein
MTLGPLQDNVWLHVGAKPGEYVERLARLAGGVVLQAPLSNPHARQLARSGRPVLLQHDARERRQLTLMAPDEEWLHYQSDLGLAVVASRVRWVPDPSPTSEQVLREAATEARQFLQLARKQASSQHSMALFAVSYRWLTSTKPRSQLIAALRSVGGAIGLMLGKGQDPLDNAHAVEGLVRIVQLVDRVAVLRCDHGALGAYAFGASGGSIGMNTSTRHFTIPDKPGRADHTDPTPRVFLPFLMTWWKGSRLPYYEGDPLFDSCACSVCGGGSLLRFQDERLKPEADAHSVACWSAMARELATTEPTRRPEHWLDLCRQAYARLDDLEDRYDLLHPPSKQLKAWLRLAGMAAV